MLGWERSRSGLAIAIFAAIACGRVIETRDPGASGGASGADTGTGGVVSMGKAGAGSSMAAAAGRCSKCTSSGGYAGRSGAAGGALEPGAGGQILTEDAGAAGELGVSGNGGTGGAASGGGGGTTGGAAQGGRGGAAEQGDAGAGLVGFGGTDDGWAGAAGAAPDGDCALTGSVFLPIADRVDLVFDEKRCFVYVSTSSGVVESYDIRKQTLRPLVDLGDKLAGIDLSPDQNVLLVADTVGDPYATDPHNHVVALDLAHRRTRRYTFAEELLESGTFMPLFISNDEFLLTSMFAGSGWVPLRRVDLATGAAVTLRDVDQDTMLALSADGSTVAFAESNASNGPVSRYSLAQSQFETVEADWFVYEIGINRDGSQLAVPLYNGLYIYDYAGGFSGPVKLGTYSSHYALAATYSPDSDVLYVSWTDVSGHDSSIEALDTKTFAALFTLDDDPGLVSTGNYAFVSGRLRVARSGNMLGATIKNGVRLYPARAPAN